MRRFKLFPYRKAAFVIFHFSFFISVKAQFYNLPNDYSYGLLTERVLAERDSAIHSSVKPYIPFYSKKYAFVADSFRVFKYIKDDPLVDKIFFDHLIHIKPKNQLFELTLDPLLNFEFGRDISDTVKKNLDVNTRGFIATGRIGQKFYFETMLAENQAFFPGYISTVNNQTAVVPGQGRFKAFKTGGFDYAFSSGFFSYQAAKNINIQAGHGKQKIGNGYRSLFLSDNAFNYPYVRITQQWFKGRLQYTNIYASLMNLDSASVKSPPNTERLFQKKAASFQHLSLNLTKWLNLGFFQGMIWQAGDQNNRQHIDWQYVNPVIFTNLAYYGLNNRNNILIGAELNIKITKTLSLYGQYMADDLSNTRVTGNGDGYQIGLKYFDAFKIRHWMLQAEFNSVTESAYTNPLTANSANQSYSHYNQNLAYTPGNGNELVLISDYKYRRIVFSARYNYQEFKHNNAPVNNTQIVNLKLGYTLNTAYNASISLGLNYRAQNYYALKAADNTTTYLYLSFKTNIFNTYYDF
ncbi:MAG: hypothetical protein ACXVP0_02790 [Bacteroidia bacterium]